MIFVSGTLLSGIGQVTDKYRELFKEDRVYSYTDSIPGNQEVGSAYFARGTGHDEYAAYSDYDL